MRPKKTDNAEICCRECLYFVQHYIKWPGNDGYKECIYGHCIAGRTKRTNADYICGEFFPRGCICGRHGV